MNEDPIAALDQMLRASVDVAKVLHAQLVALIEQGFTRDEAMRLVSEFQAELFASARSGRGDR